MKQNTGGCSYELRILVITSRKASKQAAGFQQNVGTGKRHAANGNSHRHRSGQKTDIVIGLENRIIPVPRRKLPDE
ncbi:MAG: hypothetical protein ACLT76_06510 [Clostridium fessum]